MSTPQQALLRDETRSEATARRFRGVLGEMGLSVNRAAKLLGWEQKKLDRRARHETEFGIDELDYIEDVIGIPAAYLLGFTDERPINPRRTDAEIRFIEPKGRTSDYKGEGSVIHVDFAKRVTSAPLVSNG